MQIAAADMRSRDLWVTRHAEARARQRGIRRDALELFLARADRDRLVGDGCVAWSWSRRALERAKREGIRPALLERACVLVAILSEECCLVTVMNRATCDARYQRGDARLTCRQRAIRAARRQRRRIER
jgi:hypothetical protein